ncbi:MAG: hypothetical protein EA384_08090 [Spirochaetaceae bacterium]|nr:MAG: hypothetical protein EA384_08090 [Spirochaetaceae bacterium]
MLKEELVRRSPLRILEQSIQGGLGAGNIGVIASRKGVGKTACLVHIATDTLLQGKHVIHVSFASRTDHIISWYEDIYREIARKRELENEMQVHDELVKHRVVMNFSQHGVEAEQLLQSLRAMIVHGGFSADIIMIDGYDFRSGRPESLAAIKAFAQELGIVVWFSATVHREEPQVDEHGVPQVLSRYAEHISVLITLAPVEDRVQLKLVKEHERYVQEELSLILDARTLLIAESE